MVMSLSACTVAPARASPLSSAIDAGNPASGGATSSSRPSTVTGGAVERAGGVEDLLAVARFLDSSSPHPAVTRTRTARDRTLRPVERRNCMRSILQGYERSVADVGPSPERMGGALCGPDAGPPLRRTAAGSLVGSF